MRKITACLMLAIFAYGCAASKVLRRPKAKNLDAIVAGVSRGLVLAEIGAPLSTREVDGEKSDVFTFDKGVSGGWKAGRAVFHMAADVFTLFLWEIVAWPAETIASGVNTKMEVSYGKDEKVKTVHYLR